MKKLIFSFLISICTNIYPTDVRVNNPIKLSLKTDKYSKEELEQLHKIGLCQNETIVIETIEEPENSSTIYFIDLTRASKYLIKISKMTFKAAIEISQYINSSEINNALIFLQKYLVNGNNLDRKELLELLMKNVKSKFVSNPENIYVGISNSHSFFKIDNDKVKKIKINKQYEENKIYGRLQVSIFHELIHLILSGCLKTNETFEIQNQERISDILGAFATNCYLCVLEKVEQLLEMSGSTLYIKKIEKLRAEEIDKLIASEQYNVSKTKNSHPFSLERALYLYKISQELQKNEKVCSEHIEEHRRNKLIENLRITMLIKP